MENKELIEALTELEKKIIESQNIVEAVLIELKDKLYELAN